MTDSVVLSLPSPNEFLSKVPLYKKFNINLTVEIQKLGYFTGPLDLYCVDCKQDSVFHKNLFVSPQDGYSAQLKYRGPSPGSPSPYVPKEFFTIEFNCTRNANHKIYFIFRYLNEVLQKI